MALTGGRMPVAMYPHTACVEAYTGEAGLGPTYAAKVTIKCLVEDKRRLVRNALGGQVMSTTTLYCLPGAVCPPESRVTVNGLVLTAVEVTKFDAGALPLPASVVVYLS